MHEKPINLDHLFTGHNNGRPQARVKVAEFAWFYAVWGALALLSGLLGHSQISIAGALFLLGGVCITNYFFVNVAHDKLKSPELKRVLACYQAILGIAWTSAYFYFSVGAGDLVLGMYLTVLMFAVFYLELATLIRLGIGVLASYLFIFALQTATAPDDGSLAGDVIRFLILAASVSWCYLYSKGLRDLRNELQYRNEELQSVVSRVTRIADEDHLTKSYNRRFIMDVLARERAFADRTGKQFSVLLFDIDHFKSINDRFGHLVGDQILVDFARCVKNELRGMDTINATDHKLAFGRYGGEEFIAVLPYTGIQGAKVCADRMREIVANQPFIEDFRVTVSVGVAEYQLGETVPQLLTRADQALYQAKRDGRNLVRCSEYSAGPGPENTVPRLRILK